MTTNFPFSVYVIVITTVNNCLYEVLRHLHWVVKAFVWDLLLRWKASTDRCRFGCTLGVIRTGLSPVAGRGYQFQSLNVIFGSFVSLLCFEGMAFKVKVISAGIVSRRV